MATVNKTKLYFRQCPYILDWTVRAYTFEYGNKIYWGYRTIVDAIKTLQALAAHGN